MDAVVRSAMHKWPNVPDLFGWLSLDARGHWRLQGERLTHTGLTEFIGRNYQTDEHGRWHFQNGPQRVFVTLEYTPWIARLMPDGALFTHTDQPIVAQACLLDEAGHLIVVSESGPALLDDRDLLEATTRLTLADGTPANPDALLAHGAEHTEVGLQLPSAWLPLSHILRAELPARFGFEPDPQPPQAV